MRRVFTHLTSSSPQIGGWSALHFSAENSDSAIYIPHMLSSKQELMSTSKTRSNVVIKLSFLETLCSLSVQNGWTALEIAEVKSADEETEIIPGRSYEYRGRGYKGVRDYGIVIELLRGNLVEPVTPPTHHVSNLSSF